MDFSRVTLADGDQAFLDEARDFLTTHVTDDVRRRDRETGDNFDEGVHLALGAAGYLEAEWKGAADGGFFSRLMPRIAMNSTSAMITKSKMLWRNTP